MRMRMDATDAPRGPLLPAAVQFATGVVEPTNLEGEELLRTLFYWFAHYVTTGDGDAMLTMLDECRESAPPGTTEPSRLLLCGLLGTLGRSPTIAPRCLAALRQLVLTGEVPAMPADAWS